MGFYYENRKRAQTRNTTPTKTDQSQAINTDINIIVKRINATGMAPPPGKPGHYGDFTHLPTDLRGFLELGNSLEEKRRQLPPQLRHLPVEQLLTLTKQQIWDMLTPADKPSDQPADKPEDKK